MDQTYEPAYSALKFMLYRYIIKKGSDGFDNPYLLNYLGKSFNFSPSNKHKSRSKPREKIGSPIKWTELMSLPIQH